MTNIILVWILLLSGYMVYSQSYYRENTLAASERSGGLFPRSLNGVMLTDCKGDWVSIDSLHLTLYDNDKAVWSDEGHVYYMTWCLEYTDREDSIKICLSGNRYCRHKNFYLLETDNGMEIIEDKTNVQKHNGKEFIATSE